MMSSCSRRLKSGLCARFLVDKGGPERLRQDMCGAQNCPQLLVLANPFSKMGSQGASPLAPVCLLSEPSVASPLPSDS